MKNQAQLIAYVDRLSAGTFCDLRQLLDGSLAGAIGGVHVLPFFHPIDGADAGFDPIDHTQVDPRLGTWTDVAALAERYDVMADVIVNHISRRSPQFQDFSLRGGRSPSAGMFLTYSRVFPRGAREIDLTALHTPRPTLPFTKHRTASGEDVLLWTTFTSDQIDLDVENAETRQYLAGILERFGDAGIRAVRLDAVGYAVKRAGTSCFMIPETFAFIADVTSQARARGIEVLVEVHGHYQRQIDVAPLVDWVYDFALPPLVLHTIYTADATQLQRWLDIRPVNAVTVLDTHDGIGVQDVGSDAQANAPGLLSDDEIAAVVETIHSRSRGESREASGGAASNLDTSQINCTFYDALGRCDSAYLIARAIQCFVPGVPQIYYVGLLAGTNDLTLLRQTAVGRDINRHYYTREEVERDLQRAVVEALLSLLRFRNTHPAFSGTFASVLSAPHQLTLAWTHDREFAALDVDLARMQAAVTCSAASPGAGYAVVWDSNVEASR